MPKGTVDDRPMWRRYWDWALANPGAAITVSSVVIYVCLRISAAMFYGQLGFAPEDVGLGYVETLTRMAVLLVAALALRVLIKLLLPPLVGLLVGLSQRRKGSSTPVHEHVTEYIARSGGPKRLLTETFILAAIILLSPIPVSYGSGRAAARGEPISYSIFNFAWTAEAGRVHALSAGFASASPLDGRCILLLGEANGVFAIYDPETQQSWRVPVGEVTVQTGGDLADVNLVPDDCP